MRIDTSLIFTSQRAVFDTVLYSILEGIRNGDRIISVNGMQCVGDKYRLYNGNHRAFAHHLLGLKLEGTVG